MASYRHKRGTRAQVDAAAVLSGLKPGEAYFITDESRLTVASAVNAHVPAARLDEVPVLYGKVQRPVLQSDFLYAAAGNNGDFLATAIASGTISTTTTNALATANHPGVVKITSSTTANSGYRFATGVNNVIRLGGGEVFDVVFATPPAFATVAVRMGFHDAQTSAADVDGAMFVLDAVGGLTGRTVSNSVVSNTATLATLAVSTWYHGRITVNADATSVLFALFSEAGVLVASASLTTNIPTAAGRTTGVGVIATCSGTVATDLISLDFMALSFDRSLARGAV